jgi:hypothetical protein
MQNLIVLCHQCLSWIEPQSELCPDCVCPVVLDQPDPDLDTLARMMGNPLMFLGAARVERPALPSFGVLIGTTEGVLFLPRLHRRLNGAWDGVASTRLPAWWPFRGDHTSPKFLDWLRRPTGLRGFEPTKEGEPEPIPTALPNRLIDTPGAFFAERRFIRAISVRKRMVKLERSPFRSITLVDETDDCSLGASVNSLLLRAARAIATV